MTNLDTLLDRNGAFARTDAKDKVPAIPFIPNMHADLAGLPPLLIEVGSHEILLDDAGRLASTAARGEVAVTLHVTPGVPHVFPAFAAVLEEGAEALDRAGAFLRGAGVRSVTAVQAQ